MYVLGLSAFYHDSAACLLRDGEIVAAAQEERFTRKKHDASFPKQAAAYCVREAGIDLCDLDLVAYYEKPLLKFERLLESYLEHAPRGFEQFRLGVPVWLKHKLHIPRELDRGLERAYRGRYVFTQHHEAHAASAFYPSPFREAAILTLDGVGEWATGSIARGRDHHIELLRELRFPHSLGLLYSSFTYFCGFKVNGAEYKLMGLAAYGEPRFRDTILRELVRLEDDGSFRLNMRYFAFDRAGVMTSPAFDRLFGGPARPPESEISQRELDLAASIQTVTEEIVLRMARHAQALTGLRDLVMAGGVALNCVANARLLRDGPFERLWLQPAAGDAGAALGCALFVWHQLLDRPRPTSARDRMRGGYLGPAYSEAEMVASLERDGARFRRFSDESALCEAVAELLARGCAVGHFAGRMEFGPRALGNRSILADPRSPGMRETLNTKIKLREAFRPFAPVVLRDRAAEYFDLPRASDSPYMLLVGRLQPEQRLAVEHEAGGLARLAQLRSRIPAVSHVDGSARVQTLDPTDNPRLAGLIEAFARRTGCPVLVNTSLNVRGEPIVETPAQAYRCLMSTALDALVLENLLLLRSEQPSENATVACVAPD